MKKPCMKIYLFIAVFALINSFAFQGCEPFGNDGITNPSDVAKKGFFYMTERASNSVLMLNYDMSELKRWSLNTIAPDTSLQGVTFDGQYLWLSFSGNVDKIMKINAERDVIDSTDILKSFDAPPTRQGTIRGIAHDGQYLWALNSGSLTYSVLPSLYKLDPLTGATVQTIPLSTPDPRGLGFNNPSLDVYGRGSARGIYYTDITKDKVYCYNFDKLLLDSAFSCPKPPMGAFNIYATGISSDGKNFYLVNSSDGADHLYTLDYTGKEVSRYDLPYQYPQAVVWSSYDVRDGGPPVISNISPAKGVKGTGFTVELAGSGFKSGETVSFGNNINVDTLAYLNPNQTHLYITIDTSAVLGLRDVSLTTPKGRVATLTGGFKVLAAAEEDYIYMGESNLTRIYKIRLRDSSVVAYWSTRSISSASSIQGIGHDGTDFWLSLSNTDRSLYKISLPDGDTNAVSLQSPFPLSYPGGTLRGISLANGFIYQAVSETAPVLGKIFRIDPANGVLLDTIITPGSNPRGITWLNGKLYVNDTDLDLTYVYNVSTKTWTSVFSTPVPTGGSKFGTGFSNDGTNYWMANSSGLNDHLFKLSPTGQVVDMINTRNLMSNGSLAINYDLGITGIVFLVK